MNWNGIWHLTLIDKHGNVKLDKHIKNHLANEGEESLLETYFQDAITAPSEFYIRLCNDTLIDADTLSDIQNEPSGNGYQALQVERSTVGFPTKELHQGDYMVTSKPVTWTATGTIGPVTYAYLSTTSDNTGKLISYISLPYETTIASGDEARIQLKIKLK